MALPVVAIAAIVVGKDRDVEGVVAAVVVIGVAVQAGATALPATREACTFLVAPPTTEALSRSCSAAQMAAACSVAAQDTSPVGTVLPR